MMNEDTNHPIIEMMVEEKLPRRILFEVYGKKNEDPSWDIDKLRNYIDKLTARKETIMRATSILTVQRKDCHEDRKPINCNSKETSAFSLTVSNCRGKKEDQAPKSKKRSCAFCGGHHWYSDRHEHAAVKKRCGRIREKKALFRRRT